MSSKPLRFPSREEAQLQLLLRTLSLLVNAIVVNQIEVRIKPRQRSDDGIAIDIEVAPTDLGRIVGKRGDVAEALYHYVNAFQTEHGGRYQLTFAHRLQADSGMSCPSR